VRIELELKKDADENLVMAYLFKHTPLQTNFAVNLTCLVPTENPEVGRPERLDLKQMLWHFLHFRLEVVTRRLEHELARSKRASTSSRASRRSSTRSTRSSRSSASRTARRTRPRRSWRASALDAEQTDAILELKLYRLARLEILVIQNELADKRKRARQIGALLKDEAAAGRSCATRSPRSRRSTATEADPRRTEIERRRRGRVLRRRLHRRRGQRRHRVARRLGEAAEGSEGPLDDAAARGRRVLAALAGSTRATWCSSRTSARPTRARIIDVPASTGYGEPIQKLFKFKDGERIVAARSASTRACAGDIGRGPAPPPPVHALAVTSDGYSLRFSLEPFVEPSTRPGRRYARPPDGAEVVGVATVTGDETVIAATRRRARCCARPTRSTSCRARARASS
jgi:DNA gyrase subunit A